MKQKLYVPLMNSAVRTDTREKYFTELSRLDVDTVFLALDREIFFARGEKRKTALSSLAENIAAFEQKGYEVGVWIQALGFGDTLSGAAAEVTAHYTRLRSVTRKEKENSDMLCPEDGDFVRDYIAFIKEIIGVGCRMLMLDDDLCLSVRPGLGCFCGKHISLLEAELSENLDGKDLYKLFFTGGKNKYRDAYLCVMGDTHRRFAKKVRSAVDEVAPEVRVGFCAGYTSWDIEGITAVELTKLLAGGTKPFLRFTGAPYWAAKSVDRFEGMPLGAIIEETRAQEAYCRDTDIEVFIETDSYPRPRYAVPSSLLECFSLPLRASGGMGELGYFFDYHSTPAYERGYINHRLYNKPIYDFIDRYFSDKTCVGVRVYHEMRKLGNSELPETVDEKGIMRSHFNRGAELLSVHGIPTVYGVDTGCGIAFGEEARYVDKLPKKLITDLGGAKILKEKGIDTGLLSCEKTKSPTFEWIENEKILLPFSIGEGYFRVETSKEATVISEFEVNGERFPSAYTYKCGDTELLIYTFNAKDVPHRSGALLSYARGKQLADFCGALARIEKASGVYQICKRGEDGENAMLFVNISDDPIINGEVILDGDYRHMELCGAEGELYGRKIVLKTAVPPYGVFAVRIEK